MVPWYHEIQILYIHETTQDNKLNQDTELQTLQNGTHHQAGTDQLLNFGLLARVMLTDYIVHCKSNLRAYLHQ